MYISYDGDDKWCKYLRDKLNKRIDTVSKKFPKILQHIEGIQIRIIEEFKDKRVLGFYSPNDGSINIVGDTNETLISAVHTLFHEIGHRVVDKRIGIARDYNSHTQNPSYFREEIKAESYALQIFTKYLPDKLVCEYVVKSIKYLYDGLKASIKRRTVNYNNWTTISGSYGPSTWTMTVKPWTMNTNSTTTSYSVNYNTSFTSSTNYSVSISYAC
jgi:hypothetical protein